MKIIERYKELKKAYKLLERALALGRKIDNMSVFEMCQIKGHLSDEIRRIENMEMTYEKNK